MKSDFLRHTLNIQFFADPEPGAGGAGAGAGTGTGGAGAGGNDPEPGAGGGGAGAGTGSATPDTQAIADKAVKDYLAKLGYDSTDALNTALKDYNTRKKADMTELEQAQTALAEAQKQAQAAQDAATKANARAAAATRGVQAENLDDVILLAQAKVSDKVTIDDAIKQVLEAHPEMAKATESSTGKPAFGNPTYTGGGSGAGKTDAEAFTNAFAKAGGFNLAAKK